ncbi:hypothetical protein NHX12_014465 [Muraenolepis orangiensis]|uniref:Arf-GAP with coiled-coil, ANK repeat and PH domain-containing protein n=1 Tax=Muraenolepis orangiensis TaxID=630683 RepID=A0A9Q0I6V0_9TELE|nr:hypothetical protein NHX12_014465 [Muraenolepis orangiensis]
MTVKLDFEECLKDSPRFRSDIEVVQGDVSELETRLDKLVKQCHNMLEASRAYCLTSKNFVSGLRELGRHCSSDNLMGECIDKFSSKLQDILEAQGEVIIVTQDSVKMKLQSFVKEDVRRFKEVRKEFERRSESLEAALVRNAQATRGKPHEAEEASGALLSARKTFRSEALDYINVIEAKKKTDILMVMLSLIEAQAQFFQYGHHSMSELEDFRRSLNEERHAAIKKKDMSYDDSIMDFNAEAPNGVVMEGYLYKRASNTFKTWSRRWFSIQKNQLVYQKKFKDQLTVVVEDLRLCTVKPSADNERRFCFEVRERCNSSSSVGGGPPWEQGEAPERLEALDEVQAIAGNRQSLGVHFSKVRSLTLDSWEPELIKLMCELGNAAINRIYEARVQEMTIKKPHPSSPSLHPGALLYRSAGWPNFLVMADALAHGADVNWVNAACDSRSPLLQAVTVNSLAACEFLLQNGASINQAGVLRIAKMNKEMRETEGTFGPSGDETYHDIFRDFSHMASKNPEKLKRRSADPKT